MVLLFEGTRCIHHCGTGPCPEHWLCEMKRIRIEYCLQSKFKEGYNSLVRSVDLHFLVQSIVHDQGVRDSQSVRLHRVPRAIMEVPNIGVVEI